MYINTIQLIFHLYFIKITKILHYFWFHFFKTQENSQDFISYTSAIATLYKEKTFNWI